MWAYATFGYKPAPESLIDELEAAALRILPTFSCQNISNTMWCVRSTFLGDSCQAYIHCRHLDIMPMLVVTANMQGCQLLSQGGDHQEASFSGNILPQMGVYCRIQSPEGIRQRHCRRLPWSYVSENSCQQTRLCVSPSFGGPQPLESIWLRQAVSSAATSNPTPVGDGEAVRSGSFLTLRCLARLFTGGDLSPMPADTVAQATTPLGSVAAPPLFPSLKGQAGSQTFGRKYGANSNL